MTINEYQKLAMTTLNPALDKKDTLINGVMGLCGESGQVIDIVKKNGGQKVCTDEMLRKHLIEEMADVLMFYNDVMLCYGITTDELERAYTEKFEKNMKRW